MKRYETDCSGCRVPIKTKPRKRLRLKFTKTRYIGGMLKTKTA